MLVVSKMVAIELNCTYFYFIQLLFIINQATTFLCSTLITPFVGDSSLQSYLLENSCSDSNHHQIVLILITIKQNVNLERFLNQQKCQHFSAKMENISEQQLMAFINQTEVKSFRFIQLIISIESTSIQTQIEFQLLMLMLGNVYHWHCVKCLPIIVLFDYINNIIEWLHMYSITHYKSFQMLSAIFLSNTKIKEQTQTFHIRPVLDGCHKYEGIFIPQTIKDYSRLRVPFFQCNLYTSQLNVSVNQVIC